MKPLACVLYLAALGCAIPTVSERIQTASRIAQLGGMVERHFRTEEFDLVGYWRPASSPGANLRVYIEGDGLAWVSRREVSKDPTPIDPVALRMAAADPSGLAILYLARPCQFARVNATSCGPLEWTHRRYSAKAADAIDQAIVIAVEQQREEFLSAAPIELVGYSGGGVLAANVAARRTDVSLLVTVASPLDITAWVAYHAITPLTGSLDPAEQVERLESIPQLHLVGAEDKIVPVEVTRSYLEALGNRAAVRMVEFPKYDHHCCWARDWPDLARELTKFSVAQHSAE